MTNFIRRSRIAATALALAISTSVVSSANAAEPGDSRDVANPDRMTEPVAPGDTPAIPPGAAKPEIDPAVANEEKPGAAQEAASKDVKDSKRIAEESAHVRGFSTVVNDAYLTARVKASLAVDSSTPAADINVDTENAEVTLFGIVPSDEAKSAAEEDARAIAGVAQVVNDLQVVADDRKPDVMARDAEVQGNLQKNLAPFPSMRGIGIDVKNCVVRLTGTVPAGREHDQAMQAVRKTPGVCVLKDDLRFAAS